MLICGIRLRRVNERLRSYIGVRSGTQGQLRERLRFTSAIANGHDLYAFRLAVNDAANTLFFREAGGQVIVVSEPFDKESDWAEVPPDHALIARASETVKIVPLALAISRESEAEPVAVRTINAGNTR